MSKYIDADRLIRKLENSRYRAKGKFIEMINEQEAADVQEVRHGRWMDDYEPSIGYKPRCSVCGEKVLHGVSFDLCGNRHEMHYCPNCGARMDLDEVE